MRVGIFGGTFNPVHLGHLLLAEGAMKQIPLDEVLWVPARMPPHKTVEGDVSPEDRYRMVELAIEGHPNFKISRVELDRKTPSYTIDTVRQLQKERGGAQTEWFLLLGSDAAAELPSWREIDQLLMLVQFVMIPRPSEMVPGTISKKVPGTVLNVQTPPISASEIRKRIAQGRSVEDLVPEKVRHYIEEHGLYR